MVKDYLSRFWWVACFIIIAIYHLATLNVPFADTDEAAAANYSYYGRVILWEDYPLKINNLPNPYHHYFKPIRSYYFENQPLHTFLMELGIKLFGANEVGVRLMSCVMGIISLFLFLLIIHKLKLPPLCMIGGLIFGISYLFFLAMHHQRPEGVLSFILSVNLLWIFVNKGKVLGFLAGLILILGWLVHPFISVMWISIPSIYLLVERRNIFSSPTWLYWGMGCMAGLLIVLAVVPHHTWFLTYQVNDVHVDPSPMQVYKWNIFRIFEHALTILANPQEWIRYQDPFYFGWVACIFTSIFWLIRRIKKLRKEEGQVIISSLIIFIYFGLITWRSGFFYTVYLIPWLSLSFYLVLHKLLKNEIRLDKIDLLLFLAVNIIILTQIRRLTVWVFLLPLAFRILISLRKVPLKFLSSFLIFLLYLWSDFFSIREIYEYANNYHPILIISSVILPWLVIGESPDGIKIRGFTGLGMRNIFLSCLIGMLVINVSVDLKIQGESIYSVFTDNGIKNILARLKTEKKIIGPTPLWLYDSTLNITEMQWVPSSTYFPKATPFVINKSWDIIQWANPTYVLWPKKLFYLLENGDELKNLYSIDQIWPLPWGDYVGLKKN